MLAHSNSKGGHQRDRGASRAASDGARNRPDRAVGAREAHGSASPRAGARPGDWLQVHLIDGGQPRRGQILEVLGGAGHERYRVRWDEQHESIHFPAEGTSIERRRGGRVRRSPAA